MLRELVNLFIVGAAKAGTTSIANFLACYDEIFIPPIKEPNFFSTDIKTSQFRKEYYKNTYLDKLDLAKLYKTPKHIAFLRDADLYSNLYSPDNKDNYKYLLDSSTSYLYSKEAARNIKNYNPKAKIIICLRNPYDRTFSHFRMDVTQGRQKSSNFIQAINAEQLSIDRKWGREHLYIDLSLYSEQIIRYFEFFSHNNILVLFFEDLKNNPRIFYSKIADFLNISNYPVNTFNINRKYNESKSLKVGKLKNFKKLIPSTAKELMKKYLGSILFNKNANYIIEKSEYNSLKQYLANDLKKTEQILNKHGINIPSNYHTAT